MTVLPGLGKPLRTECCCEPLDVPEKVASAKTGSTQRYSGFTLNT